MANISPTFKSLNRDLTEILNDIRIGKIQLPDFQRGWIWDDERILSLLASIAHSYPIGTVMLLQTDGQQRGFKPRPVQGAPVPEDEADYLILDGQQRLTSLFQALSSGHVVETKNARKKPIKRWYYIDMRKALYADREEAIVSIGEDRVVKNFRGEVIEDYTEPEHEYAAGYFPISQIFDSAEWRHGYNSYWDYDDTKIQLFDDFEKQIIKRFEKYEIPVIELRKETPKVAVCQVFEKVNTGGVTLTVFELLTASFAADNFSLRDDWKERNAELRKRGGLPPRFVPLAKLDSMAPEREMTPV